MIDTYLSSWHGFLQNKRKEKSVINLNKTPLEDFNSSEILIENEQNEFEERSKVHEWAKETRKERWVTTFAVYLEVRVGADSRKKK